jgi:tetratricopeptide (TPR) repeat protein
LQQSIYKLVLSTGIVAAIFLVVSQPPSEASPAKSHKLHKAVINSIKTKPTLNPITPAQSPTDIVSKDLALGDSALVLNNTTDAITKYQAALDIAQTNKLNDLTIRALAKLGNAYLVTKNYSKAIDSLTKAQAVTPKPVTTDSTLSAKIWTVLCAAYLANGDFQKADDCAGSGLPLYDTLLAPNGAAKAPVSSQPTPPANAALAQSAARLAFTAGSADMTLAAYPAAIARLQQALNYVQQAGQTGTLMEADTFAAIADVDVAQQKWIDAIPFDDKALAIYVKLANINGQRAALSDRGASYQSLGTLDKAIDSYATLLSLMKTANDISGQAQIAPIIGVDSLRLKNFDNAKTAYTIAAAASTKLGDKANIAKADLGIGVALEGLEDYPGAIAAYNAALPQYQAVGDNEDAAALLLNLGGAYQEVSQTQLAINAFNQASALFTTAGDTKSAAIANQKALMAVSTLVPGP